MWINIGTNFVITVGDIRVTNNITIIEGAKSDCLEHTYDEAKFWNEIRREGSLSEKRALKIECE